MTELLALVAVVVYLAGAIAITNAGSQPGPTRWAPAPTEGQL